MTGTTTGTTTGTKLRADSGTGDSKGTTLQYGWTIKGIQHETKAAAKKAAKLKQLRMGQWVNDVLHREALAVF